MRTNDSVEERQERLLGFSGRARLINQAQAEERRERSLGLCVVEVVHMDCMPFVHQMGYKQNL